MQVIPVVPPEDVPCRQVLLIQNHIYPALLFSGHVNPALPLSNKACLPSTVLARSTIFMRFSVSVRVTKRASAEGGNTLYRAVCRCSAAASSCRAASSPALAAMYCCTCMRKGGARCQLQTWRLEPRRQCTASQEGLSDPAGSYELAAWSQQCVGPKRLHSPLTCCMAGCCVRLYSTIRKLCGSWQQPQSC